MDTDREELLKKAKDLKYSPLDAEAVIKLAPMYTQRPNKSCDSAPLCQYLYNHYYRTRYCVADDEVLLLMFCSDEGEVYGSLPYCREEKIEYYFKLQEIYFNEVLKLPLVITCADEEGVKLLEKGSLLSGYEVNEIEDCKDYLYDAEAIRSLAGRKYSKKRNHINKFNQTYAGRWEYKKLIYADRLEIEDFLKGWMNKKKAEGEGEGTNEVGAEFDPFLELEAEAAGIRDILHSEKLFSHIRIGGIYIDGRLEAFSVGDYNPAERMAIIDVEKANEDIPGLYQVINQQFAQHEYPDALLINREDDVGIEGLRQSKLSYYPTDFERKYMLVQENA